ncbi:MinD/ParA family protein [Streptomyces sp. NPDC059491]|uniref:MinD/ParA family ATP-binding protein n=1 Tax=Streptomyces sp. NPDC059491 TaxID=3346850 RepID=UPI003691A032
MSVPIGPSEPMAEARPARRAPRPLFRIGRRGSHGGISDALRVPLLRSHRIAVIGLDGGAGKTTTALALGAVFARERADRVVAVDASPDSGALGRRVRRQSDATVRDLVAALPRLRTYMDIRAFTSQTPTGLEVVAHDPDPADPRTFGEHEYRQVVDLLSGQYPIVLTDCGTGMPHDTLRAVLELSDQLVVAVTPGIDGMSGAGLVFDRLAALGHVEKARQAVTVVSNIRSSSGRLVRTDEAVAWFRQRCRAVVTIPYDPYLARGGEVDPEWMRGRTRAAYYELSALVAQNFPHD